MVEFFAGLLEAEGIPYETAESAPGRGNIWARLEGGLEPALVLLNHTDVVPADPDSWDVDPLSGEIRDGHLYGRGALDMKSTGMLQFQAFVALHRAGKPLNRDVIFVATADEEAGGFYGAGWLVENRAELRIIVNDPAVRIEKIMGFTPAVSSTDTDLYRAITDVCMKHYPEAGITPSVSTGFTDSYFFRDLGIASYGFNAMIIPAAIAGGVHGNNERVPVDSVKQGVRMLLEIIERVVH